MYKRALSQSPTLSSSTRSNTEVSPASSYLSTSSSDASESTTSDSSPTTKTQSSSNPNNYNNQHGYHDNTTSMTNTAATTTPLHTQREATLDILLSSLGGTESAPRTFTPPGISAGDYTSSHNHTSHEICTPTTHSAILNRSQTLTYAHRAKIGDIFPDSPQRLHQALWQDKYLEIRPSSAPNGGFGLFTKVQLLPNTRLGYYAGILTSYHPSSESCVRDYIFSDSGSFNGLQFSLTIDAEPLLDETYNHIARINEYIWKKQKNNCAFLNRQAGLLTTSKLIAAGSELYIDYGEYNWTSYIRVLVKHTLLCLQNLLTRMDLPWQPELNQICSELYSYDLMSSRDTLSSESRLLLGHIENVPRGRFTRHSHFQHWLYKTINLPSFKLYTQFRKAFHPHNNVREDIILYDLHRAYRGSQLHLAQLPFLDTVISWQRTQRHNTSEIGTPLRIAISSHPALWYAPPSNPDLFHALGIPTHDSSSDFLFPIIDEQSWLLIQYCRSDHSTTFYVSPDESLTGLIYISLQCIPLLATATTRDIIITYHINGLSALDSLGIQILSMCSCTTFIADADETINQQQVNRLREQLLTTPDTIGISPLLSSWPGQNLNHIAVPQWDRAYLNTTVNQVDYQGLFSTWDILYHDIPIRRSPHGLRLCTLNINTLNDVKTIHLVHLFHRLQLDVLCLQDTRLTTYQLRFIERLWKTFLPGSIFGASCIPVYHDHAPYQTSGGVLTIIHTRLAPALRPFRDDSSRLGVIHSCTLESTTGPIQIINCYWPTGDNPHSLRTRLNAYARGLGLANGAMFLHNEFEQRITARSILAGDFNQTIPFAQTNYACTGDKWPSLFRLYNCGPGYPTFIRGDTATCIDHILHTSDIDHPHSVGVIPHNPHDLSDHRPLFATWEDLTINKTTTPPNKLWVIKPFNPHNANHRDRFNQGSSTTTSDHSSNRTASQEFSEIMLSISTRSFHAANPSHRKSTHQSFRNGWSPAFLGLKLTVGFLIRIRDAMRHTDPALRQAILRKQHYHWCHLIKRNIPSDQQQEELRAALSLRDEHNLTEIPIIANLLTIFRKRTHGRKRSELRRSISRHSASIEDARLLGKLRRGMDAILGAKKNPTPLDSITSEEFQLTDPDAIHNQCNNFAREFYALSGQSFLISLGADPLQWKQEEFSNLCKRHMPTHLHHTIQHLWTGFTTASHGNINDIRDEVRQLCRYPPSFEQFQKAIMDNRKESSPGISMISYQTLKLLNDKERRDIYRCICTFWTSGDPPPLWRTRLLCYVPKPDTTPAYNNMRPILLIDTLRKLWSHLAIEPVFKLWDDKHYFNHRQYGYRHDSSTIVPSLYLTSCLEEAHHLSKPLYHSSWDFKKAFDSITPFFIEVTLNRFGFPQHIIQWILSLDFAGTTYIKTPRLMATLYDAFARSNSSFADILNHVSSLPSFTPQQGAGQGDGPSPFIWNGFLDISLTAMTAANNDDFYLSSGLQVTATAYADDLCSVKASFRTLQDEAHLISAFAFTCLLQFSESKLRYFAVHLKRKPPPLEITKHDGSIIRVPVTGNPTVKHVGILHDYKGDNKTALREAKVLIQRYTKHICFRKRRFSIDLCISALRIRIITKLLYQAVLGDWTYEALSQIDKTIDSSLTRLTNNQTGFPHALYHCSTQVGGIGIPSLCTMVAERKWNLIVDLFSGDERRQLLGHSFTNRCTHNYGNATPGFSYKLQSRHRSWLNTTINHFLSLGLSIHTPGIPSTNTSEAVIEDLHLSPELTTTLHNMGIHAVGDLTGIDGRWLDWSSLNIPSLPPLSHHWNHVRVGQHWLTDQHNQIVSITGISLSKVNYEIHTITGSSSRSIAHRSCIRRTYSHHTQSSLTALTSRLKCRVILTPLITYGSPYTHQVLHLIQYPPGLLQTSSETSVVTASLPAWFRRLQATAVNATHCYTDGSASSNKDVYHKALFHRSTHNNTFKGSLVLCTSTDQWITSPRVTIVVNDDLNTAKSAFDMELFMLVLASHLTLNTSITTHSDCKSAVSLLLSRPRRSKHRAFLSTSATGYNNTNLQWTRSHPERRSNSSQWTFNDWGIHHADKVITTPHDPFPITQLSASDILACLTLLHPTIHLRSNATGHLSITNTLQLQFKVAHDQYTQTRDTLTSQPSWSERIYDAIPTMIANSTLTNRSKFCRLIYDKYFHGRNRSKASLPARCLLCSAQIEDLPHILFDCSHSSRMQIRGSLLHKLNSLLHKTDPITRDISQALLKPILLYPRYFMVWCGLWNATTLHDLKTDTNDRLASLQPELISPLNKFLTSALRLLPPTALTLVSTGLRHAVSEVKTRYPRRRVTWAKIRSTIRNITATASGTISTTQLSSDLVRGPLR